MNYLRSYILLALSPLVWIGISGCSIYLKQPKLTVSNPEEATKSWAAVLSQNVDSKGRINFNAISENPMDLERQVAFVAQVSPRSHPDLFKTKDSQLAYYLNAYNSLAMYNAVVSGRKPKRVISFFYRTKFIVGGEVMSLYNLEKNIVRRMGDPRIHFALNCMVRGCPRLPKEPFDGNQLDQQLEDQAKEFLNETRNVQVNTKDKIVRCSSILKTYKNDFLVQSRTLIDYINLYHKSRIQRSFKVKYIPYDWTLNQQ